MGGGMEKHSYFHEDISFSCEAVPGAVCLLRADASEKIVEFNKELLNLYQCGSREEFLQFTHGTFRGMVLASAYCPLTAMDTLWEKREEEGPLYLDFDIRTKQGHLRHIDAYLCRLERRGQAYWSMYHRAHGQETRHPYAGRGCGDIGAGPVSALHRLREDSGLLLRKAHAVLAKMTQLMLFYKDKERRFVWMNKAFLDFCGYETLASILGRTDEELALHINERTFREVEEKILTTGRPVHRYLGEAFTLGKSALVYSTKIPFYRHGKIEGLIGLVWEFEKSQLNCRGMLISGMEFMDNYLRSGKDFIAVYFCVPAFAEIVQKYGEKARLHLLQRVARELMRGHRLGRSIYIGDRICIFELDEGSRSVSNTYEWCKNGIEPMREKMQHLPVNPYYIYWNFHKKPYPHGSGLREVSAQYPPLCGGAAEDI